MTSNKFSVILGLMHCFLKFLLNAAILPKAAATAPVPLSMLRFYTYKLFQTHSEQMHCAHLKMGSHGTRVLSLGLWSAQIIGPNSSCSRNSR